MREWIVSADSTDDLYCGYFEMDKELIRCKDCKYYEKFVNGGGLHFCSNDRIADECEEPTEEDFCSWSERRER